MINSLAGLLASTTDRRRARWEAPLLAFLAAVTGLPASAQGICPGGAAARTLTANVVAFDQPIMYNRLGASNVNGMMFALKRDVVDKTGKPLTMAGAAAVAGEVSLRPDKRPRPLVLRIAAGDCLAVTVTNLLTPNANPFDGRDPPHDGRVNPPRAGLAEQVPPFNTFVDEQVRDRTIGFHVNGMQLVNTIADDSSYVGNNASSLIAQGVGSSATYTLFGEKEGVFLIQSQGSTVGADANQGNFGNGLFGQIIVEPKRAKIYRSIVTEEEMRLAADANGNGTLEANEKTSTGHPLISYEAEYPAVEPWISEGKAGLPILNMIKAAEIVHSELEALMMGTGPNGSFLQDTYPLENTGRRNPTIPNRLEPFRDFAQVWHDEPSAAQAFPGYYNDPVFKYVLAGVKDGFMINYGSGGIGSEIIANRLGVGPMHDCLDCAYEEFFLTSFTVGDPALLVDVPANVGLEALAPGELPPAAAVGPKANKVLYPGDPINVHHSYIGDFVKFRNTHVGKEQHVFHLHNHQWLYNPNDDNSNYLDAQGIGPGIGYTYEINFGGSGNRNKSAGDAIFHCHFYPHFAQGMWYHWRHYDVFEAGTQLAVSGGAYHTQAWALQDGTPAAGSRALPDGEIVAGVPLVAIVPLPGKPLAPLPGKVEVVPNPTTIAAGPKAGLPVGSVAKIDRTDLDAEGKLKNPGYPFWIAGIEDVVGQRPPTPLLDMVTPPQANALRAEDPTLFATLLPSQADGWDGGLPRHALKGYAAGGSAKANVVSPRDFTKIVGVAAPVYYPEGGTDAERAAMRFHKKGTHATTALTPAGVEIPDVAFITNGVGPVVGAPYHEPCRDDNGNQLVADFLGNFFSGEPGSANASVGAAAIAASKNTRGMSKFSATNPRVYKGVNIQFDAVLNKVGYHYPQQRIVALWQDAWPVITKQQAPEPLAMRLNTFDCAVFSHSNLVPEYFEMDDYQVRTPTDIIGQHIHLPKWDLTTTDGAANGWNYEDGTLSPGAIRERIHAINDWNTERVCNNEAPVVPGADAANGATPTNHVCPVGTARAGQTVSVPTLTAAAHPYFGQFGRPDWMGARTTMQRWFADPVVNTDGTDRGLGIVFTHDHYGPSTHQQIGLYATVLTQPAGSRWVQNETGQQLGYNPATGAPARTAAYVGVTDRPATFSDGGPTSWQAAILPQAPLPGLTVGSQPCVGTQTTGVNCQSAFREFYFEFTDFQHAYEKDKYVGAGPDGRPLAEYAPPAVMPFPGGAWIPNPGNVSGTTVTESFRVAINPPARFQIKPAELFPDLVIEAKDCVKDAVGTVILSRPCPQAISVADPGMFVVNYRNEPVALRVFDPTRNGPDGRPGAQTAGDAGDLAFALASRKMDKTGAITPITRAIPQLNMTEAQLAYTAKPLNVATATLGGDPYTPMMRAYAGDLIRVKIQAGGQEEEHNATILGMKWLQAGSGFGRAPNSGWRNSQAAGISEQFTLTIPMFTATKTVKGTRDYLYNVDSSMDGFWSGTWGLLRTYDALRTESDLFVLPNNPDPRPARIANRNAFNGVCPVGAPVRNVSVMAILANDLLGDRKPATVSINPVGVAPAQLARQHAGGTLNANGGTLVYNPRTTQITPVTLPVDGGGTITLGGEAGPLHDPTAMMYVRLEDVEKVNPNANGCKDSSGAPGVSKSTCPVRLRSGQKAEPLILRAAAGECVTVTLYNRLPAVAPDLPTLGMLIGANKRDRNRPEGSVPFDVNLIRTSTQVGLNPQLVAVDPMDELGLNVGVNVTQTVPPVDALGKGGKGVFKWYAGDIVRQPISGSTNVNLVATPVEFGGFGLAPADKIKQGQKSLVGGMSVVKAGAVINEDANQHAQANLCPAGTSAAVCASAAPPAGTARDLMVVMTKNLNHRYASGKPVEHMNGEGIGIPEDSQEGSAMALNYGIEPLWFRFGIAPNLPFGNAGCGDNACYGSIPNQHAAYSNTLTNNADPVTPVLLAKPGVETRLHFAVPHSTSRGSTLALHGHVWQRDPYVCPGSSRNGLTGACEMTEVGSIALGINPMGFAQGAQESFTPMSHWTYLLPKAGGANSVAGDYLFRDIGSFGNASGLWGILRVE